MKHCVLLAYSRTIVPAFPTEAKWWSSPNGAGDLVQYSRTMRIILKLSFRGLCNEYSRVINN